MQVTEIYSRTFWERGGRGRGLFPGLEPHQQVAKLREVGLLVLCWLAWRQVVLFAVVLIADRCSWLVGALDDRLKK
jgi:hypothetical protein